MQKLTVHDLQGKKLFTGTKQDCMHFIKCRKLDHREVSIAAVTAEPEVTEIKTTAPIEAKPQGFFKRLFT